MVVGVRAEVPLPSALCFWSVLLVRSGEMHRWSSVLGAAAAELCWAG